MRAECPNYKDIIVPIESNIDAPNLGLDEATREKLFAEVQVSESIKIASIIGET